MGAAPTPEVGPQSAIGVGGMHDGPVYDDLA